MEPVRLPRELHERMLDQALAAPQLEVCALLGGDGSGPRTHYPVANVAGNPQQAFLMEPHAQLRAMREMRRAGERLVGIYHSHPEGPAQPSETDLSQAAYPDVLYFIVGLSNEGRSGELRAYHYDGRVFRELGIEIV
jgi:[CysO sulfur-carrier protein]-S-L-cysteine hydrolase